MYVGLLPSIYISAHKVAGDWSQTQESSRSSTLMVFADSTPIGCSSSTHHTGCFSTLAYASQYGSFRKTTPVLCLPSTLSERTSFCRRCTAEGRTCRRLMASSLWPSANEKHANETLKLYKVSVAPCVIQNALADTPTV